MTTTGIDGVSLRRFVSCGRPANNTQGSAGICVSPPKRTPLVRMSSEAWSLPYDLWEASSLGGKDQPQQHRYGPNFAGETLVVVRGVVVLVVRLLVSEAMEKWHALGRPPPT